MKWREQWALEIADSKAGVGTSYQDGLADCIVEANTAMDELEAENKRLREKIRKLELQLEVNNALMQDVY